MLLEHAQSADEALRAAATFGIPGQNFVAADRAGHIGWTLAGRLPLRAAADTLQESTERVVGFTGWLEPAAQPRIEDPDSGLLWSANARVVGGAAAQLIGNDGMDRGARASQIRDRLRGEARPFTPAMSLAVQLDDRALFLERWRVLLSQLLDRVQSSGDRTHDEVRHVLAAWSGHAAPEDPAYRLVSVFRDEVAARAFAMLTTPARRRAPDFVFEAPGSFEGPVWRLLQERPLHLLTADYAGWDAFLLAALTASETLPRECRSLSSCTWGTVNTVRIAHPLSAALTVLAPLLDMPPVMLPGGQKDMPRIQGRHFGASERFSVSPGHEAEGYFEMPGAQSGHPLSPFYRIGFEAWALGSAAPFLPGPSAHRFTLRP
jgi:penicillin amidase